MERLLLAAAIVAVAAIVAGIVSRRRRADPPTQPKSVLPTQLDRVDFPEPATPWLVVIFTSSTCSTCADVVTKARVLESAEVAVVDVPFQARRDLHERYSIDAVPALLVADPVGAVQASFLGPVTATDLWAAVATARDPESAINDGCQRHDDH